MNMRALAAFVFVTSFAAPAAAVGTEAWRIETPEDFRAGKLERVIVNSDGEVTLGRSSARAAVADASLAWSMARAPDGTYYVGTGPKGVVHRVTVDAAGVPKVERAFDTGAFVVTALAVDAAGNVFAGTIPEGRIFKFDASTRKAAELVKLPSKYVWALALADGGKLLAATGPTGALYEIDAAGKHRVHLQTKEKHLLSLVSGEAGRVFVGSAPKAIVFDVAPDGKARVVHDFDGDEVRALALHKGTLFAAVNGIKGKPMLGTMLFGAQPGAGASGRGRKGGSPGQPSPGPGPGPGGGNGAGQRRPPPMSPPMMGGGSGMPGDGTLYRIGPAGRVEPLLRMPRGYFTALGADEQGNVYAGSGAAGRVYRVSAAREVAVVLDFDEKQILSLDVRPGGALALGTGNGAAVYASGEKQADTGSFFSRVFDARFPSRWGGVSWRAEGRVVVQTRAGNTEAPDETWSAWSPAHAAPGAHDGRTSSPRSRYLQLRVDFGEDKKALVRGLTAYYLQQNQRPRVTQISVGDAPSGGGMGGLFGGPGGGTGGPPKMGGGMFGGGLPTMRRMSFPMMMGMGGGGGGPQIAPPKDAPAAPPVTAPTAPSAAPVHHTQRRISWKVENPDGDALSAWVWVREQSSPTWILLNQKEPVRGTMYSWNTESFPDGHYVVKVKVSDERANPASLALTHERTSAPILVDNRKPEVVGLVVDPKSLEARAVARDSFSPIRRVEYRVDGGEWSVVHPEDELYDEREEKVRFTLTEKPMPGAHTLTVRAYDSDGNIGSSSVVFTVP